MHIENEKQAVEAIDELKKQIDIAFGKILDISTMFEIYTSYTLPTISGDISIRTDIDNEFDESTWYSSYESY